MRNNKSRKNKKNNNGNRQKYEDQYRKITEIAIVIACVILAVIFVICDAKEAGIAYNAYKRNPSATYVIRYRKNGRIKRIITADKVEIKKGSYTKISGLSLDFPAGERITAEISADGRLRYYNTSHGTIPMNLRKKKEYVVIEKAG